MGIWLHFVVYSSYHHNERKHSSTRKLNFTSCQICSECVTRWYNICFKLCSKDSPVLNECNWSSTAVMNFIDQHYGTHYLPQRKKTTHTISGGIGDMWSSNQRSHNVFNLNVDIKHIESRGQLSRAHRRIFASTYFSYLLIPRMWTNVDIGSCWFLIDLNQLFYTPNHWRACV